MLSLALAALCCFYVLTLEVLAEGSHEPPFDYVVNNYGALGDSFSAAPSAGDLYDKACSIYSECFPLQFFHNGDLKLQPPNGKSGLTTAMCSGAEIDDVIDKQIKQLPEYTNMVTVTAGGNDIGFTAILDSCIYGFGVVGHRSCADEIAEADKTLQSSQFAKNFATMIVDIRDRAKKTNIYVLGYPRFFNANTDQCSSTCFEPVFFNALCGNYYLTKERRQALNDLTDRVNSKLQELTKKHGDLPIVFLDPNPGFDGHRFCEAGVNEPDKDNINTYFYHLTVPKPPFLQKFDHSICNDTQLLKHSDIGNAASCFFYKKGPKYTQKLANDKRFQPTVYPDDPHVVSGSFGTPEFLQRLFHPTIKGEGAYEELLYYHYHGVE